MEVRLHVDVTETVYTGNIRMEVRLHIDVTETVSLNKMNFSITGLTWNDVTFSDLNLYLQKNFTCLNFLQYDPWL